MWESECLPSQAGIAVILVFCCALVQGMQGVWVKVALAWWCGCLLGGLPDTKTARWGTALLKIYTLSHRRDDGT